MQKSSIVEGTALKTCRLFNPLARNDRATISFALAKEQAAYFQQVCRAQLQIPCTLADPLGVKGTAHIGYTERRKQVLASEVFHIFFWPSLWCLLDITE
jgi:hypothetical protein